MTLLCPSYCVRMDIQRKPAAIIWDMAPYNAMHGICGYCLQCRKGLSLGLPRTHIVSEQGIMEAQRFLKGFPFYSTLQCSRQLLQGDPAQKVHNEQRMFSRDQTYSRRNFEQANCNHMLVSCGLLTCKHANQTARLQCLCIAHLLQSPRIASCSLDHREPSATLTLSEVGSGVLPCFAINLPF